ncbi:MAG: T9SS type A sorting domain-containing protein [Chitinophagaceae bacterium]
MTASPHFINKHHPFRLLLLPFALILLILEVAEAKYSCTIMTPRFNDSILVRSSFKKVYGKIKLHRGATNDVLYFSALGNDKKLYQLFVFDMAGKLVSQTRVRHLETSYLPKFEKGHYLFEIFSNDDRIEHGSLVVK